MIRLSITSLLFIASVVVIGSPVGLSAEGKTIRILTIGNSFTENGTEFLNAIVKRTGHQIIHKRLHIGGSPLSLHYERALQPVDPVKGFGTPYSNGETLTEALSSEDWDFVTIQQLSIKSHDISTYLPYAQGIADLVHRFAPQAELVVHQTWAYRSDDPRFSKPNTQSGEPSTQQQMFEGLKKAYETISDELHTKIIPSGQGFWLADQHPKYGYKPDNQFDAVTAAFPTLPDQQHSLHVGYQWKNVDDQNVLKMDGHHANRAGKYLAACIWYACLFDESPRMIDFTPEGLDANHAAFLRETAEEAIKKSNNALHGKTTTQLREDANPQRYTLKTRASVIDPDTGEYPAIGFTRGTADKPSDLQYASVDTSVKSRGQLVLWLMGHNEELFKRLNSYGLHTIDVHYARGWFGKLCQPEPQSNVARGLVRLEAATGEDHSDELDLQLRDGAAERARKFLIWLDQEHPTGNWHQFLTPTKDRVRWDKVIVSGASHGSTTATRFAKHQKVSRVVMLCGPRDQDQDWQNLYSATPEHCFFGFTHILDGGWTADHYCRSWQLLGLNKFGPIINVDQASPPYANSRRLISGADVGGDAKRAHSSVTPGRASPSDENGELLYEPVWEYLYTHPTNLVGSQVMPEQDCDLNQAQ